MTRTMWQIGNKADTKECREVTSRIEEEVSYYAEEQGLDTGDQVYVVGVGRFKILMELIPEYASIKVPIQE